MEEIASSISVFIVICTSHHMGSLFRQVSYDDKRPINTAVVVFSSIEKRSSLDEILTYICTSRPNEELALISRSSGSITLFFLCNSGKHVVWRCYETMYYAKKMHICHFLIMIMGGGLFSCGRMKKIVKQTAQLPASHFIKLTNYLKN